MKANARVDASSIKYILLLAWPAILEQILLTMATYVDTAMIGALGYLATAAVAVNSSTTWLVLGFLTALGVGYSVQVAHSLGAKKGENARAISHEAFTGSLCFGVILMLLFMLLSYYIPLWLGADEEILADARRYLFFYAAGIPFQTLLTVFSAVLRCAGDTRTPMFVNVGSNFANVVLNFLLIFETRRLVIFGKTCTVYGAGWGVAGAAIATALSYMIAAVVLLTIMFLRTSPVQLRRVSCRLSRAVTSRTIRLGLPVALERVATSSGQLVMTGIVTSLGNIALSANHVAVTAEAISYLPANGIAFAGTTVIGQEVGGGEAKRAKHDTKTFAALGLLAGLLGGVLLYTQALSLSGIFSPDEEVIQLAGTLLRIVAVAEPMFSLTIVLSGVLRGAGKTGAAFWAVAIGMWCVRIPTAMTFLHGLHWGLHGVWFAMVADLITRGVLSIWWVKRIRWESACDDSAL